VDNSIQLASVIAVGKGCQCCFETEPQQWASYAFQQWIIVHTLLALSQDDTRF
jgi:hypothetical protein